jgi:glycosyltransferase involved in cell wall biosynthesis
MRIAIVTDAWAPQINGVVRTLRATWAQLESMGHRVMVVSPDRFLSLPCPGYAEIRLALAGSRRVGRMIADFAPEAVHIATEGPLGWAARAWCLRQGLPFTTAYHTRFPEYVAARTPLRAERVWTIIRRFHAPAHAILAATAGVEAVLADHGLTQARRWGRGVDLEQFDAIGPIDQAIRSLGGPGRPVLLYVGRVAVEKNVAAFLSSRHPGVRVVVGDGPARAALERRFPDAHFLGTRHGTALAAAYRAADVLVFPSLTDTFGLVMVEALACGTPVAAFPVTGPVDVLVPGVGGMHDDLDRAIAMALPCDPAACAAYGQGFSWAASARQFLSALAPIPAERRSATMVPALA